MALTQKQQEAYDLCLQGHNVVITGQCGTGKSHLVEEICRSLRSKKKNVSVTATSGISSLVLQNIHCTTIHHWAGLKDGRYTKEELLANLLTKEAFAESAKRIRSTDVLMIDEIGMMSNKILTDLEFVCRNIKNPKYRFGNIQVIASGSFKQLAPVPNSKYNDSGDYCFESNYFQQIFPHHVKLTSVKRTESSILIKIVNELCEGSLSNESEKYIRSLSRPIANSNLATKLFATNLDCAFVNHDMLIEEAGDLQHFKAVDTGMKCSLVKLKTPKCLSLKNEAPVILTTNLSSTLVNGLQGHVFDVPKNNNQPIVVNFNGKCHSIIKKHFDIYDPSSKSNIASRLQYPLQLSYALTIHRVQGQTIENVIIDCNGIFKAGQLGVAVGRATHVDGIQILNFNTGCILKHPKNVYDFDTLMSTTPKLDCSCCEFIHDESPPSNDHEKQKIEFIPIVKSNRSVSFVPEPDHADHLYTTAVPNCTEIEHALQQYFADDNVCVETIGELQQDRLKSFVSKATLLAQEASANRDKGVVYSFYRRGMGMQERKDLFDASELTRGQAKVSFRTILICLDKVYNKVAQNIVTNQSYSVLKEIPANAVIEPVMKEKVMYLAGNTIHRAKQACTRRLQKGLSSSKTTIITKSEYLKTKILSSVRITEVEALNSENCVYIGEVVQKQFESRGLTYVNCNVFSFFEAVFKELLRFNAKKVVEFYGEAIFSEMHKHVASNETLLSLWYIACNAFEENTCLDGVNSDIYFSSLVLDLFDAVTWHFCKVCGIDFLNKYKESHQKKGKKALRVEITKKTACKRQANTTTNVAFCGECKLQCIEQPKNHSQQSICCDRCQFWYHYQCERLKGDEPFLANGACSWHCSSCKSIVKKKRSTVN